MWRRIMISSIGTLFLLTLGIFVLVKFLEQTSVFYPGKGIDITPSQAGMQFEDLYLTTKDHIKINAWLIKSAPESSTILFAHGNAGTMSQRVMKIKFLRDMGLNVLAFDYRGYGRSQGHPSEEGIYLDAQAAYDYLQTRKDIDHKRIIAYGVSLGGIVVIDLATKRKCAALIIDSSITSAKDMGKRLYPFLPSFMMSLKFDSLSKVSHISAPKLFMHSPQDHTVPFAMSQELFSKAMEPKKFISTYGGHNDGILLNDQKISDDFMKFLRTYSLL